MKWRYVRYIIEHIIVPGLYLCSALILWSGLMISIRIMVIGIFICLVAGLPQCLLVIGLFNKTWQYSITIEFPITILFWVSHGIIGRVHGHSNFDTFSCVNAFNQITNSLFHIVLISNTLCYIFIYLIMLVWGVFVILLSERPLRLQETETRPQIGGLRISQIERLQNIQLSQSRIDKDDRVVCAICLQQFTVECELIKLACSHTFHKECISVWLGENHVCPYCRADVQPDSDRQNIQPIQSVFWTVPQLVFGDNDE